MTNTSTYRGRLSAGISPDRKKGIKMANKERDVSRREAEITEENVMEGRWLEKTEERT